jgi:hypothetical protein
MLLFLETIPTNHNIKMYTDCKSLIQRCKQKPSLSPHQTMKPDADVVDTIKEVMKNSQHLIDLQHVKGHQDQTTTWHKLSQQAKMNTYADSLATWALQLPATTFQPLRYHTYLSWKNKTITKSEKFMARHAAHETDLQEKIKQNLQPDFPIDWTTLKQARSQTPQLQQFTTKLIFNWLPTYHKLSQQNPKQPGNCPLCHEEKETTMHVFTCSKHPFKQNLLKHIEKTLVEKVPRQEQQEIIYTIENNLEPLLKGITSTKWKYSTDQPWKTKLIRQVWEAAHVHWLMRCSKVQNLPNEKIQSQITSLYQLKQTLNIQDQRHIYQASLTELLATNKNEQASWLKNYSDIITTLSTAAKTAMTQVQDTVQTTVQNIITVVAGEQRVDSNSTLERTDIG